MLNEAQIYRQEEQRCEARLAIVSDPRGRRFIEQERRDWSELAECAAQRGPRQAHGRD